MNKLNALPAILVAAALSALLALWFAPDNGFRIAMLLLVAWTLIYVGAWIFLFFVVGNAHEVEEWPPAYHLDVIDAARETEVIDAPYQIVQKG